MKLLVKYMAVGRNGDGLLFVRYRFKTSIGE